MIPLYASPVLMIEQQRRLSDYARYRVLDGSGQPVADVKEYRYYAKGSETEANRPQRFGVYGTDGKKLLTLDKPKQMFQRAIHVYQKRNHIGTIVRNLKIVGSKLELKDQHGETLAEISGNWTGRDFQILRNDTEIAKVDKNFQGLQDMLTTEDKYALQFHGELRPKLRKLTVAAAVTIDQLLHEDKSDDKHSDQKGMFRQSGFVEPGKKKSKRSTPAASMVGSALSAAAKNKGGGKKGGGKKGGGKGGKGGTKK